MPPVRSFVVKEFEPGEGSADVASALFEFSPMVTMPNLRANLIDVRYLPFDAAFDGRQLV
jgi:hypothetical protein